MIPKVIHYCWFGRGEKPELAKKCIASWEKYCPDYEIIEWNEDNFDINCCDYVREAYEAGKWAFVSDYARLWIIYNYGGIYLDTDVEIIKRLDSLLSHRAYFARESAEHIATGLGFGAESRHPAVKALMDEYKTIHFLRDGILDTTPCPIRNTAALKKLGLKDFDKHQILSNDTHVYPSRYFSPINAATGIERRSYVTMTVHHFASSWMTEEERKLFEQRQRNKRLQEQEKRKKLPNRIVKHILGDDRYSRIKSKIKKN